VGDLLFKCSICGKSLAVDVSLLGRRFICPECQNKIHAPPANIIFRCPECYCELCAPGKLAMQDFECPNCTSAITIPELSTVRCNNCGLVAEIEPDYFRDVAGQEIECPECHESIPVPELPRPSRQNREDREEIALPRGFGRKTMKLDDLISSIPQAQRLDVGVCPYCGQKVHVLGGNSYVCKSCGRIMRMVNKPPAG